MTFFTAGISINFIHNSMFVFVEDKMNVTKLWNDKLEGDGDVELRVNGSVTYAHW